MASNTIASSFLRLAREQPALHGRWLPVASWVDKLDSSIKEPKLRKALEEQSLLNSRLGDDKLYIELLPKKVLVDGKRQKRWFLCISSATDPEVHSEALKNLATEVQLAWNEYEASLDIESDDNDNQEQAEQQADSSHQQEQQQVDSQPPVASVNAEEEAETVTQRQQTVTPTTTDEIDDDLLGFFGSILNPEYLGKEDLFRVGSDTLRSKLKDFGCALASNQHQLHYERWYEGSTPTTYAVKDIATMDPDPLLTNRFGIPMSVPAMQEVTKRPRTINIPPEEFSIFLRSILPQQETPPQHVASITAFNVIKGLGNCLHQGTRELVDPVGFKKVFDS